MKRLWKIFKVFLLIWGAMSLLLCLALGGCIFFSNMPKLFDMPSASNELASKNDVRFVLNWANLGDDRIEEVVHSYASQRSFTGDHLDGHAIRVSHLDVSDLEKSGREWQRGDSLTGVTKEAVDLAIGSRQEMPWFPTANEIRSPAMYAFVRSVRYTGTHPTAVQIIFANPDTKMVYYLSLRT